MAASSSAVNVSCCSAATFSRICALLLAPIRVEVTLGIAQHPGQRHLRQGLPPLGGDLVQRAHAGQVFRAQVLLQSANRRRGG